MAARHCKAIQSCYGKAPFYEYYVDDILKLITTPHIFLFDLNFAIIEQSARWLKWQGDLNKTISYTPQALISSNIIDQRDTTRIKIDNSPYMQVFFDRLPFYSGLSFFGCAFLPWASVK